MRPRACVQVDGNAEMLKHMALSPAMPAPTTMTVPCGGWLLVLFCLTDMAGATPKLMYPVLVRKRQAATAYGL